MELFEIRERFQFSMPPVGISVTRFQLGGVLYESHTARCDVEGCWMVYYKPERDQAERFLDDHKNGVRFPNGERGWQKCPSWPMREILPSGLSYVQKLWNEMDDIVDAISDGTTYQDMEPDALKAYAQGIAFGIVMLDGQCFKNRTAVAAHARDRRKMRREEIPFQATPTRYQGEWTVHNTGEHVASSVPGKKVVGPAKKAAQVAPKLDAEKEAIIKSALQAGMFTPEDLAEMYGVPVDLVKQVGA